MGDKLPFTKKLTGAVVVPCIGFAVIVLAGLVGMSALTFVAFSAAVALVCGLIDWMLLQAALGSVSSLAVQASHIADQQLPDYIAKATSAPSEGAERQVQELVPSGDAELDQIADAVNRMSYTACQTADNYGALLQRGIGDVFVDLALRNQTLLRTQLAFIDRLESDEPDPDRLENLFTLDHLTTQMQRNSDAILVLADADKRDLVPGNVAIHDVVRAAQGEIGEFNRITVLAMDDAAVESTTGFDLAHLIAELLENSTTHAPADTDVEVSGSATEDGYEIRVTDLGAGIPDEQLREVNLLLADPPPIGLTTHRWVGFNVVSRLAARLHTKVVLSRGTASTGTPVFTAAIAIPASLLRTTAAPAAATQDWLKPADPQTGPTDQPTTPRIEAGPSLSIFATAPAAVSEPVPALAPEMPVEPVSDIATPAITEPAFSEPAIAEPAFSEPAPVEPVLAAPAPVEPAIAEPTPVEPAIAAADPVPHHTDALGLLDIGADVFESIDRADTIDADNSDTDDVTTATIDPFASLEVLPDETPTPASPAASITSFDDVVPMDEPIAPAAPVEPMVFKNAIPVSAFEQPIATPAPVSRPQPAASTMFTDTTNAESTPMSFDNLAAFTDIPPAEAPPIEAPLTETPATNGPAEVDAESLPEWLTTDYDDGTQQPSGLSQRTPAAATPVNADVAESVEALTERNPENVRNVLSRYKSGRNAAEEEG